MSGLKIAIFFLTLTCLAGCDTTRKPEPLLSPCVGVKGSPCEKFPINTWLIKK